MDLVLRKINLYLAGCRSGYFLKYFLEHICTKFGIETMEGSLRFCIKLFQKEME